MEETDPDICGAKTRDGSPCQRPAGWGTEKTRGRCKQHGGKAGRPPTHGRYSKAARESLAEKIEEAREQPIEDIRDEVAVLRALLNDYLNDVATVDEEVVSDITKLATELRRAADTKSKMDARASLTTRHVEYLQARFADILTEYVPDEKLDAAIRDLRTSIETDESALDI